LKIHISDSAFFDLHDIKDYYLSQQVPHIGDKFVCDIIKHIETLPENPDKGRKVPEFNQEKIRELIHPPFRIVYLREKSTIHIVRIWRSCIGLINQEAFWAFNKDKRNYLSKVFWS
jgi:plasmid stabilization system protein ParE